MSLKKKVFSDSIFTAVRTVISTIRGIIVIPIITNLLGAGSYGIWVTVLAFVAVIGTTGQMQLHGSLIRYGSQDSEHEQTYSDVLSLTILIGSLLSITIFVLGYYLDLTQLFNGEVVNTGRLALAVSILVFGFVLFDINVNFPRAKGRVKVYDLIKIFKNAIEAVVLVFIFLLGGTLVTGLLGLATVYIIFNVIIMFVIFSKFAIPTPSTENLQKYVRYSGPLIPMQLSSRILIDADKYMILLIVSPAAVGIYAVAHEASKLLGRFSTVLRPTLYPRVTNAWENNQISDISNLYASIFRYYSILAIPSFLGLTYLSFPILMVFSTEEIASEGQWLVPILAFGFLIRGYDSTLTYILTATENTGLIAKAIIIGVVANVSLNIVLIWFYGILGAAVATTFSHLLIFYFVYKYSTSKIGISVPKESIARCLLSAVAMLIVIHLIMPELNNIGTVTMYPLVGALVYFVSLVIVGEINRNELNYIIERIRIILY